MQGRELRKKRCDGIESMLASGNASATCVATTIKDWFGTCLLLFTAALMLLTMSSLPALLSGNIVLGIEVDPKSSCKESEPESRGNWTALISCYLPHDSLRNAGTAYHFKRQ